MEGSYKITQFEGKTDADNEAGKITKRGNDHKNEVIENQPKMFQRRFPSFTKNVSEYFSEYSSNSTIQGLSYMGEKSRSVFERFVWLIFFCISISLCGTLVAKTYTKWKTSPVLVSFATKSTPIWKIPFPAVTICPDTKVRQSAYNFTENYYRMLEDPESMTDTEKKQVSDLSLVCTGYAGESIEGNNTIGYDTIDFLMEYGPEFDDMMLACKNSVSRFEDDCSSSFTPILTEEGVCHTFNMLNRSEIFQDNIFQYRDFMSHDDESEGWTLEAGYQKLTKLETYPRRTLSAGFQARLQLDMLNLESEIDYLCMGPVQGFKIILHHPAETPSLRVNYILVPYMQQMTIAIKPDMMTTSEDLRSYDPHTRQCYFPEERNLTFYRTYSQQNCEMECLTNFIRKECKCVGFHMPHEEGTPICGPGRRECMNLAQNELLRREAISNIYKEESGPGVEKPYDDIDVSDIDVSEDDKLVDGYDDDIKQFINEFNENYEELEGGCDCLPGCNSLVYNAETSQADLNINPYVQARKMTMDGLTGVQFTKIFILFKEQQFMTSERTELYSSTEFLSNCGGILGLFTGFSFLSLVEILYFLSLRLFCNIKRYGKHYWSGSQELVTNEKYHCEK